MERQEQDMLAEQLARYDAILAQSEILLFDWDVSQDSLILSGAGRSCFAGLKGAGTAGDFLKAVYPEDLPLLQEKLAALKPATAQQTIRVRLRGPEGNWFWCRIRGTACCAEDGSGHRICGTIINIDEELQEQLRLREQADRDPLSGLLNGNAARKRGEDCLRTDSCGAMLVIDLDNFKAVNDRHGHLYGDKVLIRAAGAIKQLFRAGDIVARIGGDEFLVMMPGVSRRITLEDRCCRLRQALQDIVQEKLECSVGIAMWPEHGSSYQALFQRADAAMYSAKQSGRTAVFCDTEIDHE